MSQTLTNTNITGLVVGNSITIPISNLNISANPVIALKLGNGTMRMHNESGTGLLVQMKTSGDQFNLPAGGWIDAPIKPGESAIVITALYIMSLPPVQLLLLTYYQPGEPVPPMTILGNSPIAGSTNTTIAQSVSNESGASATLFIDGGLSGSSFLIQIYTDGSFIWSVMQGATPIQIFKGQTSGNPLLLGKAGKIVEVLGSLLVDGTISNPAGIVGSIQPLIPGYHFDVNATYSVGSPITKTLAGVGGIPTNASGVFISGYGASNAVGAYLQFYPPLHSPSDPSQAPLLFQEQVANNTCVGTCYMPLDNNGQMIVQAFTGNFTGINLSVYAYVA